MGTCHWFAEDLRQAGKNFKTLDCMDESLRAAAVLEMDGNGQERSGL